MPDPTPDGWRRVRDAFDAAADRPPADREAALDAACRTPTGQPDPALRAEVEALLAADTHLSFLDVPAAEGAAELVEAAGGDGTGATAEGTRFGAWRVLEEIGRGGMGAVYLVERADGAYAQRAALKRLALAGPDRTLRFEQERQILAALDHPGIARLIDGGVAPSGLGGDGVPYLVMEYVDGEPITQYADGLDTAARIRLFVQACDAVGHAHRHLVVHRDLKPSHVLVTEDGGEPSVKLLDFGVAKLLEAPANAELTRTALPLLTPEYAAPEQVTGGAVTTATDVYALGVILYEMLAGRRPYEVDRGTLTAIVEAVRDTDPAPASAVAPDERRRVLRGDLDAITAKALEKDPDRRYGSANELADDLRRYLDRLPVQARPPTASYRIRRFVRRHRAVVAAAGLVVLAVAAGLAATLWQAREARRAAAESEAVASFLVTLLSAADPLAPERLDTLQVADLLDEGAARVRVDLARQPGVQARLLHVLGTTYRNAERWDESEPLLRTALDLERQLGAPPATLAALQDDLAETQSGRGEHREAVALAEEALRQAHASRDAEALVRAEHTLGRVRLRAAVPEPPDSLLRAARDRAEALYGRSHLVVAEIERTLGEAALAGGRVDEAERHVRRAIEITTGIAGADHARLIGYYQFLSFVHLVGGETAAAEAAARHAVELARTSDPGSDRLGNALAAWGQALRRLGRLDEAEAALREAVPLNGRRKEDRATPLGTLASVLEERGDLDAAIATQAQSYRLLQEGVGRGRPVVVTSALKLARMMCEAEHYAAAEVILGEAEAYRAGLTSISNRSGRMLDRQIAAAYAALYEAWGRPEDAARYRPPGAAPGPAHGSAPGSMPRGHSAR